ncbi:MAG: bifunctional hydroxymethylpyrimidine kinase/phosphomethylpyrimidine kinase [Candidatus Marinimicrobia bacterium]|nr:bifunctional hydroxymethylpyrimidine kinase/phosphomethylpyrimidine kinase [Candidatus Neomarinimicrobiota bacterium]
MNEAKPILAVGSIALDSLETHRGRRDEILGGSATYFSIAASLFAPVRLVGVVGDDFPSEGWEMLQSRNIDLSSVQVAVGQTFRWGARYNKDFSERQTLFTELGVFATFRPEIKNGHQDTPFLFLGNIQPDLQISVSALVPQAEMVICDTMNLWIDQNVEKLKKVLERVHIFLLNDEEAIQLTGINNLEQAASALSGLGPEVVVIKRGSKGALLAYDGKNIHIPIYPHVEVKDPTGAGDTFAGGLIGHLSRYGMDDLQNAVITAAAVASFTVENFGLEGILSATPESIQQRREVITQLMHVELTE